MPGVLENKTIQPPQLFVFECSTASRRTQACTYTWNGKVNRQNKTLGNNKGRICIQMSCIWVLQEALVFKCHHERQESTICVINTLLIRMPDTKQRTDGAIHMAQWKWLHPIAVQHFQAAVVTGDVT